MAKKIACIISDDFEELELVAFHDILTRCGAKIDIYSIDNKYNHRSSHKLRINGTFNITQFNPDDYDALYLCGGPHCDKLLISPEIPVIIDKFIDKEDKYVGAICAAPAILGKFGYLEGKRYTCFPPLANKKFRGKYVDAPFIRFKHLVTGRGPFASIDFALAFAQMLYGRDKLESVKKKSFYYIGEGLNGDEPEEELQFKFRPKSSSFSLF